ncbi:GT2 family glycosyltransferase [Neobacillus niacini]|uniref:glycosyltransferase family 2 protein n=1 Tax=Neobacillus niacini TaxID=86668 RepID=UPI002861C702|nr:glycosyltransferase [Neobacillus niacini]MDR7076118.1 GT2 family glycosyltransferase [Neobacillus niacini]
MIEVSIIIPSYNRYPLNLLSLYALENQTFDLSKMEVILIDDASTDDTPQLRNYNPLFRFHYVRNKTNMGLSSTRNIGLKMAHANIIIFLDSEVIADPDYVRNQHQYHLTEEQTVVVGRNIPKLYTHLFPDFNSGQINEICDLANNSPFVKKRLQPNIKNMELRTFIKDLKEPVQLLDKVDINKFSNLQSFSVPDKFFSVFYEQLGNDLDNRYISWWALFGLNHSLKKDLIVKAGGYDEEFKGWGMEDVEFAYRLYKSGAKFVLDPHSTLYHQEHPIRANKKQEARNNELLLLQKHPVFDVYIRSLKFALKQDLQFIGIVLQEHDSLCHQFPGQFEDFKSSIILLMQYALQTEKKPVHNLLLISGIGDDPEKKDRIFSERNMIEKYGKYGNLVQLFDLLAAL